MATDRLFINRLLARAVIGLNEWERRAKQDVLISAELFLDLTRSGTSDKVDDSLNYGTLVRQLLAHVEASERHTVEALATDVAGICLANARVKRVRTKITKPAADRFARSIGVRLDRTRSQLESTACVGLASNQDPETNLPRALEAIRSIGEIRAVSSVYQTASIGGSQSPDYLNAAVAISTCLPAAEVRRQLKAIEKTCGRDASTNGPLVPIDLDLCLLGDQVIEASDIRIPHRDVLTRPFLPLILSELNPELSHPSTGERLADIARRLGGQAQARPRPDIRLTPTSPSTGILRNRA